MNLFSSLAAQREQYLQDKRDQQDQYKRALSAQVRVSLHNLQVPPCVYLLLITNKSTFSFLINHSLHYSTLFIYVVLDPCVYCINKFQFENYLNLQNSVLIFLITISAKFHSNNIKF